MQTIKKRIDFLSTQNSNIKYHTKNLLIICKENNNNNFPRFGLIVTKKIGNAVIRNKIKRRIRESLREILKNIQLKNHDFVIIAKTNIINIKYNDILYDINKILKNESKK